jgi:hypothetical protein
MALAIVAAVPLVLAGGQAAQASGGWTQTSPLTPPGATSAYFGQVSCPVKDYCVAVGTADIATGFEPFAELWDGTGWTLLPTPAPPAGGSQLLLNGVSCLHPTFCLAYGYYYGFYYQPVTERWNGTTWTPLTVPEPSGVTSADLTGVSCVSDTDCLAVGSVNQGPEGSVGPFADSWNGKTWTLLTAPMPSTGAVACPAATFCEVVGGTEPAAAESWNGTAWTAQSLSLPAGATLSSLSSVWCGSPTDCVAVGNYKQGPFHPLAELWNGTAWTRMPTAQITDLKSADLEGVSCGSADGCVAVGTLTLTTAPKANQPFAMHWNGTRWTLQSAVIPAGSLYGGLSSVSCHSSYDCTSVGAYQASKKVTVALAEQDT